MKKVTLDDIAKKLDISKSLVSRALSNKYGVSEEVKLLVKQTAYEMNYKGQQQIDFSGTVSNISSITVLLTKYDFGDANYYSKIIAGIENSAKQKNISLLISLIDSDEIITNFNNTNGIIIIGRVSYEQIIKIKESKLPTVLVDCCYYSSKDLDTVMADNFYGCYSAVNYAVSLGHKNIAFVGDPNYSTSFVERHRGFCEAVKDSTAPINPFYITEKYDDLQTPLCVSQLKKILSSDNRPSICVCANDSTATLVYKIAASLNINIPNELSVIGFDNIHKCDWLTPTLTTVYVPMSEIGRSAVILLIDRIQNFNAPARHLQVGTYIKIRKSSIRLSNDN